MLGQTNQVRTSKGDVSFWLLISDQFKHLYDLETKTLDQNLSNLALKKVIVFEKQPDDPLPWYKKTFAFIANIKPKHQFIVFELESGVYGSLDLYSSNKLVLRIGNMDTIIDARQSGKRRDSTAVKINQKLFMIQMSKSEAKTNLGDLLQIAYELLPTKGYSQISFNGSHYSQAVMGELAKEKKAGGSIIRYKLVRQNLGFSVQ